MFYRMHVKVAQTVTGQSEQLSLKGIRTLCVQLNIPTQQLSIRLKSEPGKRSYSKIQVKNPSAKWLLLQMSRPKNASRFCLNMVSSAEGKCKYLLGQINKAKGCGWSWVTKVDTIKIVIFFHFYILFTSLVQLLHVSPYYKLKENWSISTISVSILPTTYKQEGVKYFVVFFF